MRNDPTYNLRVLRNSFLILLCFAIYHSAFSASFSSGGGKKKDKKSTITTLNFKANTLKSQNGYIFRNGLSFSSSNVNGFVMQGNSIRYQKGNNLYVLPYKQKIIFRKFITPQKELR